MTKIDILTDRSAWQPAYEDRRADQRTAVGFPAAAVSRLREQERERIADWTVAALTTTSGDHAGFVAVGTREEEGTLIGLIGDLWIAPEHLGAGHDLAARDWAENFCREAGATRIGVKLPGESELFADYELRAQNRIRALTSPVASTDFTCRSLTADEYPQWLATEQEGYISDILRAGGVTEAQARAKSDADFAMLLPEGLQTPNNSILVLEDEGRPVGSGWLRHDHLPGVTYGYGIRVAPEYRGHGFGRAGMAAGEAATLAAGDTALTFTVWEGNTVAMNLYTAAGYQVASEYRSKLL
ncbi:GNAT family N-acetyltransferase [Kitasatospora sp. LaBMicrA B282]|uniref:GNAT family N-acetyltransferase n=1 Tax=Kitasatospora sp. LaBMicrA B282 TaxID=3420949 RepID=UPI003D10E63B